MDELTLFWTHTAKRQRDRVFDYWNKRNKSTNYSKKLSISINKSTQLLKAQPEIGKETDFEETKTISMGHYSIFYKIDRPELIITGFWDNRDNLKKLLEFLQNK
ncbi:type II toxin-antitoxin system RelE/ParE family toxin [uncultured Christiangramia sp.]|uniref:type II toxin-antitoxin system RelE/ParE family toxin n=1 Tax=Christiangramia sp. 3-2217-3z TaxID=3417564 RepID=UPI00261593A6|nr:type II toxin-antitoxin system RelE/ParE family toxin [uncultured Christiangramia sp.]